MEGKGEEANGKGRSLEDYVCGVDVVEGKERKVAKWWGLSKGKMHMLKYVLYN